MEQLALGSAPGTGGRTEAAPLFVDGQERRSSLPTGWYLQRVPSPPNRRLAHERICQVLTIPTSLCPH